MMSIESKNRRFNLSSNKFFRYSLEDQNKIELSTDDDIKISLNNFGETKESVLYQNNEVYKNVLEKRDKDGMIQNTFKVSDDMERLEIDRIKSSFESPEPNDSTSCYQYERHNEYVESFIPISKDHTPFSISDSENGIDWSANKLVESNHPWYQHSSQSLSYTNNESLRSLPQSLLLPIL